MVTVLLRSDVPFNGGEKYCLEILTMLIFGTRKFDQFVSFAGSEMTVRCDPQNEEIELEALIEILENHNWLDSIFSIEHFSYNVEEVTVEHLEDYPEWYDDIEDVLMDCTFETF